MIRFPKVNIASSVVNRILNINDEINRGQAQAQAASRENSPTVPDTSQTGPALEKALYSPPAPVDAPPEVADAVALKGWV